MVNYHRKDQRVRDLHAVQLRAAGHTWQSICDTTDYWKTPDGARKAVTKLLDAWESESVAEYRNLQDQRYLALVKAWWPLATGTALDENDEPRPPDDKAAAIVLRTMEAINRLHDLNKEGLADNDGRMSPEEFQGVLAEVIALSQKQPPRALTGGARA